MSVVQNGLTTGLITYKIWKTTKKSSNYLVGPNYLTSLLRIMIESAALYFAVELALLCMGFLRSEALNILRDIISCIAVDVSVVDKTPFRALRIPSSPSVW